MFTRITHLFFGLLFLLSQPTLAHDLQYAVNDGKAVVVKLFFMDNTPFAYENYEIYREQEVLPFQTGRTDAHGYFSFIPDAQTQWHIKAFSADGHGMVFDLTTNDDYALAQSDKAFVDRYGRIVIGLGVIFGIFGLLSLWVRKKGENNKKN